MTTLNRKQYQYNGEPWTVWPEAEQFFQRLIDNFFRESSQDMRNLREKIERTTHTHLLQWVDYIAIDHKYGGASTFYNLGFQQENIESPKNCSVFWHPEAQLPRIILNTQKEDLDVFEIGMRVDSIVDFTINVESGQRPLEGFQLRPFRKHLIEYGNKKGFFIVERHGYRTYIIIGKDIIDKISYEKALYYWKRRARNPEDDFQGMNDLEAHVDELVAEVGQDLAADIVMRCEREYWQSRNRAAQYQYSVQNSLGLGWANADHHTFRSSREHFHILVRIFEKLGFHCREKFHAGAEAGWGAQVMEQPICGFVVFADVDLLPHEVDLDFAHQPLAPSDKLGTIGLWCGLHGESILQAGMHHLEIQCNFNEMRTALTIAGIEVMQPFNDSSHLRQAFTKGEMWRVDSKRIKRLLDKNLITVTESERFSKRGAVGSHLEILERPNGAFKGFGQAGVSRTILATDPRKIL